MLQAYGMMEQLRITPHRAELGVRHNFRKLQKYTSSSAWAMA